MGWKETPVGSPTQGPKAFMLQRPINLKKKWCVVCSSVQYSSGVGKIDVCSINEKETRLGYQEQIPKLSFQSYTKGK